MMVIGGLMLMMSEALQVEVKNMFTKNTKMSKNMVNHTVDIGESVKEVPCLRIIATKNTKGTVT